VRRKLLESCDNDGGECNRDDCGPACMAREVKRVAQALSSEPEDDEDDDEEG
jgi:hypothetical protein